MLCLVGCSFEDAEKDISGCKVREHPKILVDCFYCQRKTRYWELGCLKNQHWDYYENCQYCLEKAGNLNCFLQERALLQEQKRAVLAQMFNDYATSINSGAQGRRKSTAEHGLEGFSRGLATGLELGR